MKRLILLLILIVNLFLIPIKSDCQGNFFLEEEEYINYYLKDNFRYFLNLPKNYDARNDNIITPAKDQGNCGSCWAFTLVATMESHILKKSTFYTKDSLNLSEQQLISCCSINGLYGCNGGSVSAIDYWREENPIRESCFPYKAKDTECTEYLENCKSINKILIKSFYSINIYGDKGIENIKNSVITDGSCYLSFKAYTDFYDYWNTASKDSVYVYLKNYGYYITNHAVELIGWNDSKQAFLCKNSWGRDKGPNGDGTFYLSYNNLYSLNIQIFNYKIELDENNDNDNDGYTNNEGDCDDNDPNTYPGAVELCDGKDNNCDDEINSDETIDNDSDGYTVCEGDCDDNDPNTYPEAVELCDGKDNNCDGIIPLNEMIIKNKSCFVNNLIIEEF